MIIGKSNERGGKRKIRRGNEGVAGIKWIKCYGREIFESLLQSMELSLQILPLSLSLFEIRISKEITICNEFVVDEEIFQDFDSILIKFSNNKISSLKYRSNKN